MYINTLSCSIPWRVYWGCLFPHLLGRITWIASLMPLISHATHATHSAHAIHTTHSGHSARWAVVVRGRSFSLSSSIWRLHLLIHIILRRRLMVILWHATIVRALLHGRIATSWILFIIRTPLTSEKHFHDQEATENHEHAMNKLFLVAWNSKTELFAAETSSKASLTILLLTHFLLELISLLLKEFALLLEELFEVLLGFLSIKGLASSGPPSVPRLSIP